MREQSIEIRASDAQTFSTSLFGDADSNPKPAIIIFTPIFGLNDDMRKIAQRWSERDYLVAVPDYFFRVRPGILDRTQEGRAFAMERWRRLDVDQTVQDVQSLRDFLQKLSGCNGTVLSLGFCAGGELAFLGATRLQFDAIATFHATHIHRHLDEAQDVSARMTMHYGDKDKLVPLDQVETIRAWFADNPRVDIHLHSGAEHSFTIPGVPAYHETAAVASDRRAEEVFREVRSVSCT